LVHVRGYVRYATDRTARNPILQLKIYATRALQVQSVAYAYMAPDVSITYVLALR
jgi:hypothetical protein